ncbi:MAG TPA: DUF4126 domain-containing protein [Vicinamibacterales bacterium]|nr:DUF4126 domain-containing protein [Vicinamibacterales bacterium]
MLTSPEHVAAFLVAVCFAAGLNVYGTVAALGLVSRAGLVVLPGDLGIVQSWWVIGACLAMFVIEFVADKVPLVDLVWNVLQTFVRVPVAGLLAYGALPQLDPGWQLAAGAAGSALALLAHSGKTTMRAAVSASPEPASNIGLSLAEDGAALILVWFATQYPYVAAAMVLVMLVTLTFVVRWIFRRLRKLAGPRVA